MLAKDSNKNAQMQDGRKMEIASYTVVAAANTITILRLFPTEDSAARKDEQWLEQYPVLTELFGWVETA